MLEVRGVHKAFDGFQAVAGVTLGVARGQIAAIIGPNGAGKTTFFNLVTGHLRPDAGAVILNGRDITGLAGGLFGIFNRGVFPDFAYWTKSSEVLIMTLLGGMGSFWGPAVGALVLLVLNQQITSYTEYWPFVLGTVLIVILFAFPGGIVGALAAGVTRLRMRRA